MFTIDEFNEIYSKYLSGYGIDCKRAEYCRKQHKCTTCPLYYMSNVSILLFMLNNTPDYPRVNRLYLETQNGVKKVAYFDENLNSWEIEYTCME